MCIRDSLLRGSEKIQKIFETCCTVLKNLKNVMFGSPRQALPTESLHFWWQYGHFSHFEATVIKFAERFWKNPKNIWNVLYCSKKSKKSDVWQPQTGLAHGIFTFVMTVWSFFTCWSKSDQIWWEVLKKCEKYLKKWCTVLKNLKNLMFGSPRQALPTESLHFWWQYAHVSHFEAKVIQFDERF